MGEEGGRGGYYYDLFMPERPECQGESARKTERKKGDEMSKFSPPPPPHLPPPPSFLILLRPSLTLEKFYDSYQPPWCREEGRENSIHSQRTDCHKNGRLRIV